MSAAFIRLFFSFVRTDLLPRYPMSGFSNIDETDRKYSLAPTDDLITLWRSKVKVNAGRGECIHVRCGVTVHLVDFLW